MCKLAVDRSSAWRRSIANFFGPPQPVDDDGRPVDPTMHTRLEAELAGVLADNAHLRVELGEVQQALSDAASEIHVAGPVAHRIRMLKEAHGHEYSRLASQTDQEIARLRKEIEVAAARARDRNLTMAAAIAAERELRIERDAWRSLAGRISTQLADEARRYDGLALQLLELVGTMRRDGFNPRPSAFAGIPEGELVPTAASNIPRTSAEDEHKWALVMEAAQERSGGNAELLARILGDAHRWKGLGVPLEEIAKRVWDGDGL